jgi:translocation and assembly module TamB
VVSTERGEYTFMSKRFQITRGSAMFIGAPELNPTVQATAEYPVQVANREAINIRVLIGGTLRNPKLSLESDAQPPLPQSDLISYLAFGRPTGSLLSSGNGSAVSGVQPGGDIASTTRAFVQRQLTGTALGVALSEFEAEASRSLGADVFDITPAETPIDIYPTSVGQYFLDSQVEVGKYVNPHTFVSLQVVPAGGTGFIPGVHVQHRLEGLRWQKLRGIRLEGSLDTRYQLSVPTLDPQPVGQKKVFGAFVIREWRF